MNTLVLDALSNIIDPDLGKDIVSLGFVKDLVANDGHVSFKLELTTPACPVKDQFKAKAEELVGAISGVKSVQVQMTAQAPRALNATRDALKNVRAIIAVASCKGGVGKSTVAVNLAYSLAKAGARVGVFDADVYGPSLPALIKLPNVPLILEDNKVLPREFGGVKLMSFGFAQDPEEAGPAMMRGPMVTQVVNQLLGGTNWGELDYLVLDLPPGTGDIHITLAQIIPITAALMVTTPQELSLIDVLKGIQMFDTLKIPTVAVVENMSYFRCGGCDTLHKPFGEGALALLQNQYGFSHTYQLPITSDLTVSCDEGVPFVTRYPDAELTTQFYELQADLVREIAMIQHMGATRYPKVSYQSESGVMISQGDDSFSVSPYDLRKQCQCAQCIDEWTNQPRESLNQVPKDVHPLKIEPVGNYAVGVNWSDGHASLYPYLALMQDARAI